MQQGQYSHKGSRFMLESMKAKESTHCFEGPKQLLGSLTAFSGAHQRTPGSLSTPSPVIQWTLSGALEFRQVEVEGDARPHEHVMSEDTWHRNGRKHGPQRRSGGIPESPRGG